MRKNCIFQVHLADETTVSFYFHGRYCGPVPKSRPDLRRALHALAFQQAGYFSAKQAREVGYSYQAQKYHADAGNWLRIDRGIFRLPYWPYDPEDVFVRWTLWSHGQGVVSHDSALAVHGLSDVDPVQIHLTVPPGFSAHDDLIATHTGDIEPDEREQRRGWEVTTPLRTLADFATTDASQEHVDRAVADALRLGLIARCRLLRTTADLAPHAALRLERALAKSHSHV